MSLLPGSDLPDALTELNGYVLHAGIYFVWTALFIGGDIEWKIRQRTIRQLLPSVAAAFVFGLMVEILQGSCTNTRQFDLFDLLANAIGAVFSAGLYYYTIQSVEIRNGN